MPAGRRPRQPAFGRARCSCKEPLLGPPKCTSVQVWKKALAKGAPANAIAELGYRSWANKARWYFSIEGTKVSDVFDDDCR